MSYRETRATNRRGRSLARDTSHIRDFCINLFSRSNERTSDDANNVDRAVDFLQGDGKRETVV